MEQQLPFQQTVGGLTIFMPSESSPILVAENLPSYENTSPQVCACVNFLRAGCPSTQIMHTCRTEDDDLCSIRKREKRFFSVIRGILATVSLPYEAFNVAENGPIALITRIERKSEAEKSNPNGPDDYTDGQ